MEYELNNEATTAWAKAAAKGIPVDSLAEIIELLQDQEIVSYCNHNGCISFDVYDIEEV